MDDHNYTRLATSEEEAGNAIEMTEVGAMAPAPWPSAQDSMEYDQFLQDAYDYYCNNGYWCNVIGDLLNVVAFAFVIAFGTFLVTCVDYAVLFAQYNVTNAVHIPAILSVHPFVLACDAIFLVILLFQIVQLIRSARRFSKMRHYYKGVLHISDTELPYLSWTKVQDRLLGDSSLKKAVSSELDIANRLMRYDNFMIGLVSAGLIHVDVPVLCHSRIAVISYLLESIIKQWLVSLLRDESRFAMLKSEFHFEKILQTAPWYFRIWGLLYFLFMPFSIIYQLSYMFFRYADELRSRPGHMSSRQWTPYARWRLRHYDELPHIFRMRANGSIEYAEKYVQCFTNGKLEHLARFVALIAGAFVAVLLAMSVWDSNILVKVTIANQTILWYLTLFGILLAAARASVSNESQMVDPTFAMQQLHEMSHMTLPAWVRSPLSKETYDDVTRMFTYRFFMVLDSLFAAISAPIILLFILPRRMGKILEFIRTNSTVIDGLGPVYSVALLRPQWMEGRRPDEVSNADGSVLEPTNAASDALLLGNASPDAQDMDQRKMERSLVVFSRNNPGWNPTLDSQRALLRRVDEGVRRIAPDGRLMQQSETRAAQPSAASHSAGDVTPRASSPPLLLAPGRPADPGPLQRSMALSLSVLDEIHVRAMRRPRGAECVTGCVRVAQDQSRGGRS